MRTRSWLVSACMAVFLAATLASCSSKMAVPTEDERREARRQVACIAALPAETLVNTEASMTYPEARVLENGAEFIDAVLAEELAGRNHIRIISSRQLNGLLPEDTAEELALFKKIGSDLKCEAVLKTTISRFEQREGGSYGAESPASARFSMKLISTRDGNVLWLGMFNETQQSLLSNLFSFEKAQSRGFKWITVEDLVRQGVIELIESSPYL